MIQRNFSHSGDLGDIIYSLPTIRAMGGGKLFLINMPGRTREQMTPARVAAIRPLLEAQYYIEGVEETTDKQHDTNLNGFRNHGRHMRNLADMHLATYGLLWHERSAKWLNVEARSEFPVIVNRSPRYHGVRFPWDKILSVYKDQIAFIGLEDEHRRFCALFSKVPYLPTPTLLDAAQVIAGSKLYVGNQSCCAAIAEGLKHNMILEVFKEQANCSFKRLGKIEAADHMIELPEI